MRKMRWCSNQLRGKTRRCNNQLRCKVRRCNNQLRGKMRRCNIHLLGKMRWCSNKGGRGPEKSKIMLKQLTNPKSKKDKKT
jgi:hypothetical protein